ncbi:MAG: hypothetical protein A3K30_05465 [Deltaproteobacteria bacterium RBG_13_51_10]|nr:MAG: hypothetical protein A3K30_05465 [Deltaproteobacteria bacterium RBG_13_51_10]
MQIIEHKGKRFIEINGKQFYLWQAYRAERHYGDPIFLQLYGKTPLRFEDLPDKKWIIIKTRTPGQSKKGEKEYIYTAYDKDYFDLDSNPFERKENQKMFLIGRNRVGSAYLAISTLARLFDLPIPEETMMQLSAKLADGKLDIRYLEHTDDLGNLRNTAYYVKTFGNVHWGITAEYLKQKFGLEPKKNGRKKKNGRAGRFEPGD